MAAADARAHCQGRHLRPGRRDHGGVASTWRSIWVLSPMHAQWGAVVVVEVAAPFRERWRAGEGGGGEEDLSSLHLQPPKGKKKSKKGWRLPRVDPSVYASMSTTCEPKQAYQNNIYIYIQIYHTKKDKIKTNACPPSGLKKKMTTSEAVRTE